MKKDRYAALAERHLLLQEKYLRLKDELERFLKKKTGYRELRSLLNEISPECSVSGDRPLPPNERAEARVGPGKRRIRSELYPR